MLLYRRCDFKGGAIGKNEFDLRVFFTRAYTRRLIAVNGVEIIQSSVATLIAIISRLFNSTVYVILDPCVYCVPSEPCLRATMLSVTAILRLMQWPFRSSELYENFGKYRADS